MVRLRRLRNYGLSKKPQREDGVPDGLVRELTTILPVRLAFQRANPLSFLL